MLLMYHRQLQNQFEYLGVTGYVMSEGMNVTGKRFCMNAASFQKSKPQPQVDSPTGKENLRMGSINGSKGNKENYKGRL